jgi:spore coat protein U-like protein
MRKIQAMTLIFGAAWAGVAGSATTATTFAVTETVQATCSATATTLAFSAYTLGAGVATANDVTVFGQLPDSAANQAAVPGSYTDTITVTVTY